MDYGGLIIAGVVVAALLLVAIVKFVLMLVTGITFTAGALKKSRRNDPDAKKKLALGITLIALPLLLIIWIAIGIITDNTNKRNDLYHQANLGTVEGMERILKKGVPADCIAFGDTGKNIPATGTETTVLGYLASYYNDNRNEREQYGEKIQLLIDYGADVNRKMGYLSQPDNIVTPYLMAISSGNYDLIDLLLKNGANVNERYADGSTALDSVNKSIEYYTDQYRYDEDKLEKYYQIKELLLKHGAKTKTDI